MSQVIGIDLGTTFSASAFIDPQTGLAKIIPNSEGKTTTPSVVMFDGDDVVVGEQAKSNSMLDPYNVIQFVKRNMGNPDYSFERDDGSTYKAEDVSAIILKRVVADSEAFLGDKVTDAVITVPAYFSDAQRKATINAGQIAGLNVLAVINEPTAAALAFGMSKNAAGQNIMVYDIGGGTFDVTIIHVESDGKMSVVATGGDRNLGGFDFDNALINYAAAQFESQTGVDMTDDDEAMQELREKCESAKISLSQREKVSVSISACGKKAKVEITRAKFEQLSADVLDKTRTIVEIVMDDAQMKPSDLAKVLLVGGSSRMPIIRQMVRDQLQIEPSCELNPDEAVALGAAYYADLIRKGQASGSSAPAAGGGSAPAIAPENAPFRDVNSHGLGVAIWSEETQGLVNSVIIPKNTPIPAQCANEYCTMQDNQELIELQITEGDDEDLSYVTMIGNAEIRLRPHPAGSPVRVVLALDGNGVIYGEVYDLVDNVKIGELQVRRQANMDDGEVERHRRAMASINPV
ncbi:MAG: Hsp70 family protein [Gemmiger sp.]